MSASAASTTCGVLSNTLQNWGAGGGAGEGCRVPPLAAASGGGGGGGSASSSSSSNGSRGAVAAAAAAAAPYHVEQFGGVEAGGGEALGQQKRQGVREGVVAGWVEESRAEAGVKDSEHPGSRAQVVRARGSQAATVKGACPKQERTCAIRVFIFSQGGTYLRTQACSWEERSGSAAASRRASRLQEQHAAVWGAQHQHLVSMPGWQQQQQWRASCCIAPLPTPAFT